MSRCFMGWTIWSLRCWHHIRRLLDDFLHHIIQINYISRLNYYSLTRSLTRVVIIQFYQKYVKGSFWVILQTGSFTDTLVHLKSGLACVAIFGESPDFLEKSFLGKRKSPDFLEKACFSKIQKSWFSGEILEKDKIKNGKNDWGKTFDNAFYPEISSQDV